MSETRHTPEPWEIEVWGHELFGVYPNPAGPEGVIARVTEGGAENKANAHRIVACVNACAGIADPADLRRQRDELLAALHGLHGWLAKSVIEKQPAIDDLCAIDATVAKSTTPTTEMK